MYRVRIASAIVPLLLVAGLYAQQSSPAAAGEAASPASDTTTIRGCLEGERGSYIVVEKEGAVFALKGVGNKLDSHLNHEVEVKGEMLPGTVKTGIRPEKAGSNPSDTLHGIDGTPFQVKNVQSDVRTVAKRCKAADAQ
jgi:hypothetical protein